MVISSFNIATIQPAHQVVPHLVKDVVERGLKDEGTGTLILLAEVGHQVRRDGGAQAVTPHNNLESFKLLWQC